MHVSQGAFVNDADNQAASFIVRFAVVLLLFEAFKQGPWPLPDPGVPSSLYRGADKSSARPWKETSYSDEDLYNTIPRLMPYKQQPYIAVVCTA